MVVNAFDDVSEFPLGASSLSSCKPHRSKKVWDAAKVFNEAQHPAVEQAFKLIPER